MTQYHRQCHLTHTAHTSHIANMYRLLWMNEDYILYGIPADLFVSTDHSQHYASCTWIKHQHNNGQMCVWIILWHSARLTFLLKRIFGHCHYVNSCAATLSQKPKIFGQTIFGVCALCGVLETHCENFATQYDLFVTHTHTQWPLQREGFCHVRCHQMHMNIEWKSKEWMDVDIEAIHSFYLGWNSGRYIIYHILRCSVAVNVAWNNWKIPAIYID